MNKYFFSLLICIASSLSVFSGDYYWVDGAGKWSDISHWRTTSGGSITPNVVPGPTDDVFFDLNSGFTKDKSRSLTIDVTANCRNITVSGTKNPPDISFSYMLNVYGSAIWQEGTTNAYSRYSTQGIIYQNTNTPKTITSNGVGFNNVYFYETTSISLLDDFAANRLTIYAGTWNTNNFRVDINDFVANSGSSPRTLNLGSSEIYIGSLFNTNSQYITLNSGTSHIYISGYSLGGYSGQIFNNVSFEDSMNTATVSGGLIFNRVEFKGNGTLNGNNTFNELIFSSKKTYTLEANSSQTIKKLFTSTGSLCTGMTIIQSSVAGNTATIAMPASATVDISGVMIKDITANGGAKFIANNSIDNGGNSGWTFTNSSSGSDLYWVGGAGNWNDTSHWSTTSGGIGGACIPSPNDNVFFDVNSGFTTSSKTVTIDLISYCRDITFSGSEIPPSVQNLSNTSMNIYGSSIWQKGMTINITYIYYQDTKTPKTITSNGVGITCDRILLDETSSISLLDDFKTNGGGLMIRAGTWNTNNFRVDIGDSFNANGSIILNLGNSDIYIGSLLFTLGNKNIILNAGTSHIHFTTGTRAQISGYSGHVFNNVSFDNSTSTASIVGGLVFNQVEFKGNGAFNGNNTFNELIFSPKKTYTLDASTTQTINRLFSASGSSCTGSISIHTSTTGSTATISMPANATLDVSGVILQNIAAKGGAEFIAKNSIDNGGNSGWTITTRDGMDLYWVGGTGNWNDASHWSATSGGIGGACIPSRNDNVFFDANSGFTTNSKTITIDLNSYCRDITFEGSGIPPLLKGSGSSGNIILDIYGSSIWQEGMTIGSPTILYRYQDAGVPKTITSNGVDMSYSTVYFYETSSISLLDDFNLSKGQLNIYAGIWNTNNFKINLGSISAVSLQSTTINPGSSDIYINGVINTSSASASFSNEKLSMDASKTNIYFTNKTNTATLYGKIGQVFHNVSFESTGNIYGGVTINQAEFKGSGTFNGNNTFNELILLNNKGYTLQSGKTQTIKTNLVMSGTPCEIFPIKSSNPGTQANLEVLGGNTNFNFVNMTDINASGLPLHFGAQSTIANQNNTNVTFDPYDPGALSGLGPDWLCHTFDDNNPDSYILSASGFFGNQYTQYSWTKVNDPDQKGIISKDLSVDLREFGYGTYQVEVTYSNGISTTCNTSGEILITPETLAIEVSDPLEVCRKEVTKLSDIDIEGEDLKWYETVSSLPALDTDTVLVDGNTYYVTQTMNNCESARTAVTVKLVNCNNVYINPNLRLKVRH